ncbi:MAG: hypothetical protein ABSB41_03315 [Anaerolineales bacterium]
MRSMMIGFRILATLVLIGLLVGGGVLLYRAGWSQGYLAASAAKQTTTGSNGSIVPWAPGYLGYGPRFYPGLFFPFGFLFTGLLIFFAGFFLLRLIFFPFRMAAWESHHHGWRHEGWEGHPTPPWMKERPGEHGKGEADPTHTSEPKP